MFLINLYGPSWPPPYNPGYNPELFIYIQINNANDHIRILLILI